MKTLYLLRHAKSSWKDPGLDDLDRPLNERGRESAKTMAAYLRRARISPDVVVCSTALRAKQTLEPIANAIKPPRVTFESRIYGVAQPELLKYLRGLPESVECALLIGHNPGLHDHRRAGVKMPYGGRPGQFTELMPDPTPNPSDPAGRFLDNAAQAHDLHFSSLMAPMS